MKKPLLYLIPLAASFLFFLNLGSLPFSFDELVTARAVTHPDRAYLFYDFFRENLHPPLYFYLLKFLFIANFYTEWLGRMLFAQVYVLLRFLPFRLDFNYLFSQYFSYNIFGLIRSYNEFSARLLSAVCMTLANFAVFDFLRKRGLVMAGAAAVLFMGMNGKLIYYAQDARPYALFTLLTVLVAREFFEIRGQKPGRAYKKWLVLNGLLLLTHFYAVFLIAAEVLILAFRHRRNTKVKIAAALAVFLPLASLPWLYSATELQKFPFLHGFGWFSLFLTFRQMAPPSVLDLFYFAALLFLAVRLFRGRSRFADRVGVPALVLINTSLIVLGLACLIRPVFSERYVLNLIPLQLVLLVCALQALIEDLSPNIKLQKAAFSLLILGGLLVTPVAYSNLQKQKPIEPAYAAIAADADYKNNKMYALEEVSFRYFEYYEAKYHLQLIRPLFPRAGEPEKNEVLSAGLKKSGSPEVFYYLQVWHPELSAQPADIHPEGYRRSVIYTGSLTRVFKFTKAN